MTHSARHNKEENTSECDIPCRMPIAEVMIRISDEAQRLSRGAAELELEIGELLKKSTSPEGVKIQTVDSLRQELEGLAQFLEALIETLDVNGGCLPHQAALNLKLGNQVTRLCSVNNRIIDNHNRETVIWTPMDDSNTLGVE